MVYTLEAVLDLGELRRAQSVAIAVDCRDVVAAAVSTGQPV